MTLKTRYGRLDCFCIVNEFTRKDISKVYKDLEKILKIISSKLDTSLLDLDILVKKSKANSIILIQIKNIHSGTMEGAVEVFSKEEMVRQLNSICKSNVVVIQ
ncbi:MAG: hypothetical protein Q4F05_14350 [bacterium]|nr:hypothetical protein [bacterium]